MKKNTILINGGGTFPFKYTAANDKFRVMAKIFQEAGYSVYLTSKLGCLKENPAEYSGRVDGVNYVFFNRTTLKSKSFFNRQVSIIKGFCNEFIFIKRSDAKVTMLLSICYFWHLIYYILLAKFYKLDLVLSIMEWHPEINYKSRFRRINARIFHFLAKRYIKKAITISHYINEKLSIYKSITAIYTLPPVKDTVVLSSSIDMPLISRNYYLYCGSLAYFEVLEFIVNSYEGFIYKDNTQLVLVVSGSNKDKNKLTALIKEKEIESYVEVRSGVSYDELYNLYLNAFALLAPLRPTIQDKARFPHKISEYSASKRPIITNSFGEVAFYFSDLDNAFVCENYSEEEYAQKLNEVYRAGAIVDEIGERAYNTYIKFFYYKKHIKGLARFI